MAGHEVLRQTDVVASPEAEKTEKYALLSVYDKTGIVDFAKVLDQLGYKIISTGGTARTLTEAGLSIVPIEEITGNPESFDGRMKTISFPAEGGILYDRTNPSHVQQAKELGVPQIDIVVCNLYPFEQTIAKPNVSFEDAVENIDVGGPTMLRSAAKNHKNVLPIVDPEDYAMIAETLLAGKVDDEFRRKLAARTFDHLSFYDAQIAQYLRLEQFPKEFAVPGRRVLKLRYGENPHQKEAWAYIEPGTNSPMKNLKYLGGREASFVNLTDIAAGIESTRLFDEPTAAIIKHGGPSGTATDLVFGRLDVALRMAFATDPLSAFGSTVVVNTPIDLDAAKVFAEFKDEHKVQIDISAAPSITDEAMNFIRGLRRTTGIYIFGEIPKRRSNSRQLKFFDGGFAAQGWDDDHEASYPKWEVKTKAQPTEKQLEQMKIAWKFISRIKSNTIIVVDKEYAMTRGIGSAQPSRVGSAKLALEQAGEHARGAILASDALIPFDDIARLAVEYGIAAVIQTGGAQFEEDTIKVLDEAGIVMVNTGERKFWH